MTISARELRVNDSSEQGNTILFLEPNISPDSGKNMRSMLKVHITSGAVPETTAKNSSVMITASGFTYHVSSDIAWVNDLARFAKAPPGVSRDISSIIRIANSHCRLLNQSFPANAQVSGSKSLMGPSRSQLQHTREP